MFLKCFTLEWSAKSNASKFSPSIGFPCQLRLDYFQAGENSGTERLAVHRDERLLCGDNERHCGGAGQLDLGAGHFGLCNHYCPHPRFHFHHALSFVCAKGETSRNKNYLMFMLEMQISDPHNLVAPGWGSDRREHGPENRMQYQKVRIGLVKRGCFFVSSLFSIKISARLMWRSKRACWRAA